MEVGRRKGTAKTGVVAGSVWESRMKSDEFKGGIKVFNDEEKEKPEENGEKKLRPKQSPIGVSGKRKTWKSENSDGLEKNPVQIARQRPVQSKDLGQQCKELSLSADGMKIKSPIRPKKTRSEVGKELSSSADGIERSPVQKMRTRSDAAKEMISVSVDGIERSPVQIKKAKSESQKLVGQSEGENGGGVVRNSVQLRKVKSESHKGSGESVDGNDRNSIPLTKSKSLGNKVLDEPLKDFDGSGDGIEGNSTELSVDAIEKNPAGIEETGSEEICKEFGVCEEKVISSSLSNLGQVKSAPQMEVDDHDGGDGDDDEEDWDEEFDEEVDEEIEIDEEEKNEIEVKEIDITEEKPKVVVNEEKKIHKVEEKPVPISPIVKKQAPPPPPLVNKSRIHPIPTKTKEVPVSNGFQRPHETQTGFQRRSENHNKLQSLVDLVMWRDVSKSAFVFGLGTFIIISLSYTKDLNISFITVVSYLGLVYLAAIFLFRSIICRGVIDGDDTIQDYVVGQEEAMWFLKMVLPYLNEFLMKLRALFSGDPSTTMKLAVLLFVLARCGSSITIWKMAKLGFFGVFTVPKICSSYSPQLTAYGKFWVRRFKDAWESCSHKKAVAFGIFTLVWNLSSVVARIWAVFMLYVAFRYYQQSMVRDDWVVEEEEEPKCETTWQDQIGGHRRGRGRPTTTVEVKKEKKRF